MSYSVRVAAAAAIFGLAALSGEASAQAWKDQINVQMLDSRLLRDFMAEGYTRTEGPIYDQTKEGDDKTVEFTLVAGKTYQFIGKCDNNCSDLDLRVYDERDNLIDSDIELDDIPLVEATPARNGKFKLKVTMADCSARNCGWGVVVYGMARPNTANSANSASANSSSANNASASTPAWKTQINQQILDSKIVADFQTAGYTRSHDLFYDLVADGAAKTVDVSLQPGKTYQFVGKCDNDCTDLDFRLYDENNNEIDSDTATDDYPVVTVSPLRAAQFHLRVVMVECSTTTCGWGVIVLAK